MSKTETQPEKDNPFRSDKANELWKRLDKQGKPVSKEEILKRAAALKTNNK